MWFRRILAWLAMAGLVRLLRRILSRLAMGGLIAFCVVALSVAGLRVGMATVATGYEHDAKLSDALTNLTRTEQEAHLRDLTGFEWERVHVFAPYTPAADVNRISGQRVIRDGSFYDEEGTELLVFARDGKVVRALSVRPDRLVTNGKATWGRDVRLVPTGFGAPAIHLVEPRHIS